MKPYTLSAFGFQRQQGFCWSRGLSLMVSDMQQRPTRFTVFGVYQTEASARSQIMGICKV